MMTNILYNYSIIINFGENNEGVQELLSNILLRSWLSLNCYGANIFIFYLTAKNHQNDGEKQE